MRGRNLPRLVLEHIGIGALQDAGRSTSKTRCMLSQVGTASASFHANQSHLLVRKKLVEDPHCIRASTNAGNYGIWESPSLFKDLLASFATDAAMKIAHHYGIGMSAKHRSQ